MDEVFLRGMEVECIVGLYPTERKIPQQLRIDLCLRLDTKAAGTEGRISGTVDYAEIGGEVRFLLESARFFLIETACEAIACYLLAPPLPGLSRAPIEEVEIEMSKIDVSVHGAVPGVKIRRRREDMSYGEEHRDFGKVDVLFSVRECGIYRLRLKPGGTIPTHVHRVMDESELFLTDGLSLQGQLQTRGYARRWPKDAAHRYDNHTDEEQTILCVDCPAFLPEDEILVDMPLAPLSEIPAEDYYDMMRHDA